MDDYIKALTEVYQSLHKNANPSEVKKIAIQAYNNALSAMLTSKKPFRSLLEEELLKTLGVTVLTSNLLSLNQIRLIKKCAIAILAISVYVGILIVLALFAATPFSAAAAMTLFSMMMCALAAAVVSAVDSKMPPIEENANLLGAVNTCPIQMRIEKVDLSQFNSSSTINLAHLKRIYAEISSAREPKPKITQNQSTMFAHQHPETNAVHSKQSRYDDDLSFAWDTHSSHHHSHNSDHHHCHDGGADHHHCHP